MNDTIEAKKTYFEGRVASTYSPMDLMGAVKATPEKIFLVDVRNAPDHLKKEKIMNAALIPLQELEGKLDTLPKDKVIVVYCWDVWCNMGSKAALLLLKNGFNVRELAGGIAAWNRLEMPTVALI